MNDKLRPFHLAFPVINIEKTISWYMENLQIWKNLDSNIFESTPWKVSN